MDNPYESLREEALKFSGDGGSSTKNISMLLMETAYPNAIATLMVAADGTVSLYFSNGGGIIGLGGIEEVRQAAETFLNLAEAALEKMDLTLETPTPEVGMTVFYAVTPNGTLKASDLEENYGEKKSPLSPLFYAAHEVITEIRISQERLEGGEMQ